MTAAELLELRLKVRAESDDTIRILLAKPLASEQERDLADLALKLWNVGFKLGAVCSAQNQEWHQ